MAIYSRYAQVLSNALISPSVQKVARHNGIAQNVVRIPKPRSKKTSPDRPSPQIIGGTAVLLSKTSLPQVEMTFNLGSSVSSRAREISNEPRVGKGTSRLRAHMTWMPSEDKAEDWKSNLDQIYNSNSGKRWL
jgi:hypothetical protein